MRKALLIIDVQEAMFDEEFPVYKGANLIHNIQVLLHKARSNNTAVFFIQHNEGAGEPLETGTDSWKIHHNITPEPNDRIIQKASPDSFYKTNLHEQLQHLEITDLIITGIQTEICVDTTVRSARSLGYQSTLVADTHSTFNSAVLNAEQIINHHNNTLQWFAKVKPSTDVKF